MPSFSHRPTRPHRPVRGPPIARASARAPPGPCRGCRWAAPSPRAARCTAPPGAACRKRTRAEPGGRSFVFVLPPFARKLTTPPKKNLHHEGVAGGSEGLLVFWEAEKLRYVPHRTSLFCGGFKLDTERTTAILRTVRCIPRIPVVCIGLGKSKGKP